MPPIDKMLKDEIQRLAKKELKAIVASLRQDIVALKHALAEHKQIIVESGRGSQRIAKVVKSRTKATPMPASEETEHPRITGKLIRRIREKLDLSQAKFARLVGVSTQSVYQWEHKPGQVRFRDNTLETLLQVRGMGVREAQRRLEALDRAASSKPAKAQSRHSAKTTKVAKRTVKNRRPQLVEMNIEEAPITAKMIHHHRERLGLSQKDLATLLKVHHRSVFMWEHKPGNLQFQRDVRRALLNIMTMGKSAVRRRLEALVDATKTSQGNGRTSQATAARQPKTAPERPDEPITARVILETRKRLGLSQAKLARLLNLNTQTVYQWEHRPGVLRFRGNAKAAVLAVQRMDVNEVAARLGVLEEAPAKKGTRRGRKSREEQSNGESEVRPVEQSPAMADQVTAGEIGPEETPISIQPMVENWEDSAVQSAEQPPAEVALVGVAQSDPV